jgi:2,3-bisphosphoglycerate-independent phosphoglycerate mutase
MDESMTKPKPLVLVILDGWGHREDHAYNAASLAHTKTIDTLFAHYPHRLIEASGEVVGLPAGQIGNSEVGHMHLGAGRLIKQSLTRINESVDNGELTHNPMVLDAVNKAKSQNGVIHILGLVSPGGVHSHQKHIAHLIESLWQDHQQKTYCHAFLDGRDVPPQSAEPSLKHIEDLYAGLGEGSLATICGRFYAMDRDQRWDRIQAAFDLLIRGEAPYQADDAVGALHDAYTRGETDEFVAPTLIKKPQDKPVTIQPNDVVIFMNFRADRAIQLSRALTEASWDHFDRGHFNPRALYTLTSYQDGLDANIIFDSPALEDTLGSVLAKNHLKQLRIAETEKYAHVTYFFNGGNEAPNNNEDRILIPSPKVATYDLAPAMSALEMTNQLCEAIRAENYDVIICNYANADMVGHTGKMDAAIEAMEALDQCLEQLVQTILLTGGTALITADHGNIELMFDEKTQQPHTAHTNQPVPLLFVSEKALSFDQEPASLSDVAPTMLSLLGLEKPEVMTGRNLLHES